MTWAAAIFGLLLVTFAVRLMQDGGTVAHAVAGVIFVVAGLLFMLPVLAP